MKEKIDFLLNKRQKIWFKEGAPKKLKTVAAILDYVLAWGFLFVGSMLLYRFAVAAIGNSIEVVVGGNQSSRLPELSVDYLYVAIILSFFVGVSLK
jgi:hypothetical protein